MDGRNSNMSDASSTAAYSVGDDYDDAYLNDEYNDTQTGTSTVDAGDVDGAAAGDVPRGDDANGTAPYKSRIVHMMDIAEHSIHTNTTTSTDVPLFEASPSAVHVDDYVGFNSYDTVITLRNNDSVPRQVKIEQPTSHHLTLSAPHKIVSKVAPGMTVSYTLTFSPEARADYQYDLICVTEREKFVIPFRAYGERAALEFVDAIDFGDSCPVNHATTRTALLRNTGPKDASYRFLVEAPYTIEPAEGIVQKGYSVSVPLTFAPDEQGTYRNRMVLEVDGRTSAQQFTDIVGTARDANIYLDEPAITMDDTFVGRSSQRNVIVYNDSDVPTTFRWTNNATAAEDVRRRAEWEAELQQLEEDDRARAEQILAEQSDELYARAADKAAADGTEVDAAALQERVEFSRLKINQALTRKYAALRREAVDQGLFPAFSHPTYTIEPVSGEVFPGGVRECTVTFRPGVAQTETGVAFCHVTGRASRLQLDLSGTAIGPRAEFAYESLDMGDVFVHAFYQYSVVLSNTGAIPARFMLVDIDREDAQGRCKTLAQSVRNFTCVPESGSLQPSRRTKLELEMEAGADIDDDRDDCTTIIIDFCSKSLGRFTETMSWALEGTAEPITLTFTGNVIGPTFNVVEDEIDFGVVSYGFQTSRAFTIQNTSDIPMSFTVRVPQDGAFVRREFHIVPPTGTILPQQEVQVQLDFISETVQCYKNYTVVVDVDDVDGAGLAIPLRAECVVPEISLNTDSVALNSVFIDHEYTAKVMLRNSTQLRAKFEYVVQDAESAAVMTVVPDREVGSIAPGEEHELVLTCAARQLGPVSVNVYVRVPGSGLLPHMITVTATSVGPAVTYNQDVVDFGSIEVLKDTTKLLILTNKSPIAAHIKAFAHKKHSNYTVSPSVATIPPNSVLELLVTANLNETLRVNEQLHVIVNQGVSKIIPLRARGFGTTIASSIDMDLIHLTSIFTNKLATTTFTLENKGRRPQMLTWNFIGPAPDVPGGVGSRPGTNGGITSRSIFEQDDADGGKRGNKNSLQAAAINGANKAKKMRERREKIDAASKMQTMFKISPVKATLEPGTSLEFTLSALSGRAKLAAEQWICQALVGTSKELEDIFTTTIAADFTAPLLQYSSRELTFRAVRDPSQSTTESTAPPSHQSQELTMTNVTKLPLAFYMKCASPFTLSQQKFSLTPGETASTTVSFVDTSSNALSLMTKSHISVRYRDHTQRDSIALQGDVLYPNLIFDRNKVDFGCVLNNTSTRVIVKVKNNSQIAATYHWAFLSNDVTVVQRASGAKIQELVEGEDSAAAESVEGADGEGVSTATTLDGESGGENSEKTMPKLELPSPPPTTIAPPAAGVFDIAPIRGCLEPGQEEDVEFIFNGRAGVAQSATVVCEVVGGPSYTMELSGNSSTMSYRVDTSSLDFASLQLDTKQDQYVYVHNTGRVAFSYAVDATLLTSRVFSVSPLRGDIPAGGKQKLTVRCWSRLPDQVNEQFSIKVAFFDPVTVTCSMRGVYAQFAVSLPRMDSDDWIESMECALLSSDAYTMLVAQQERDRELLRSAEDNTLPDPRAYLTESPLRDLRIERAVAARTQQAKQRAAVQRRRQILQPFRSLRMCQGEADRQLFLHHVLASMPPQTPRPPSGHHSPSSLSSSRISRRAPSSALSTRHFKKTPPFTLSRYLCDFGNVVYMTSPSRTFTVTNTSVLSCSIEVDKRKLTGSVYSIAPLRVQRLPPGKSVTFTVSVKTNAKRHPAQLYELDVPFAVRNAPEVMLRLRANITVPSVKCSMSRIDFGKVYTQQQSAITVQMHNPETIACDWIIRKPAGWADRDHTFFTCVPSSGTLAPGAKCNVVCYFRPRESRTVHARLPLRVTGNSQKRDIVVTGTGLAKSIVIEPANLTVPPILPYSKSAAHEVTLTNTGASDVEVYSVEFDKQYAQEEDALRAASGYDEELRCLFFPPRQPGDGIPASVTAEYQQQQQQKQAEAEAAAAAAAGSDDAAAAVGEQAVGGDAAASDENADAAAPNGSGQNIVVMGPPGSGRTTMAHSLAEEHGLCEQCVSIDDIVRHYLQRSLEKETSESSSSRKRSAARPATSDDAVAAGSDTSELSAAQQALNAAHAAAVAAEDELAAEVRAAVATARQTQVDIANEAEAERKRQQRAHKGKTPRSTDSDKPAAPEVKKVKKKPRRHGVVTIDDLLEDEYGDIVDLTRALSVTLLSRVIANFMLTVKQSGNAGDGEDTGNAAAADVAVPPSPAGKKRTPRAKRNDDEAAAIAAAAAKAEPVALKYANGIIFDGAESVFVADRRACVGAIRRAFEQLIVAQCWTNTRLGVVVLDTTRELVLARRAALLAEAALVRDDKEALFGLKRHKEIPARELAKLPEEKRQRYEELQALAQRIRWADDIFARFDPDTGSDVARIRTFFDDRDRAAAARLQAELAEVTRLTSPDESGGNNTAAVAEVDAPVANADVGVDVVDAVDESGDVADVPALDVDAVVADAEADDSAAEAVADGDIAAAGNDVDSVDPDDEGRDAIDRALTEFGAVLVDVLPPAMDELDVVAALEAAERAANSSKRSARNHSRAASKLSRPTSVQSAAAVTPLPAMAEETAVQEEVVDEAAAVAAASEEDADAVQDEVHPPICDEGGFLARMVAEQEAARELAQDEVEPADAEAAVVDVVEEQDETTVDDWAYNSSLDWVSIRRFYLRESTSVSSLQRRVSPFLEQVLSSSSSSSSPAAVDSSTTEDIVSVVSTALHEAAVVDMIPFPDPRVRVADRRPESAGAPRFQIVDYVKRVPPPQPTEEEIKEREKQAAREARASARRGGSASKRAAAEVVLPVAEPEPDGISVVRDDATGDIYDVVPSPNYRWIIPAGGSVTLNVQFSSRVVERVSECMRFEIVGDIVDDETGARPSYELACNGACDVPSIADNPRSVFMRRVKKQKKSSSALVSKQYIGNEKVYDFGALVVNKTAASRLPDFDANVEWAGLAAEAEAAAAAKAAAAAAAAADAKKSDRKHKDGAKKPATPPTGDAAADATAVDTDVAAAAADNSSSGLGIEPTGRIVYDEVRKMNGEVFRITNSGLFDLDMNFTFRDQVLSSMQPYEIPVRERTRSSGKDSGRRGKKDGSSKKKSSKSSGKAGAGGRNKKGEAPPSPVFMVEPQQLSLPVNNTQDVIVWAFPLGEGVYNDALVCCVQHNPVPVVFPVRCHGARPTVEVSTSELVFERSLLGQSRTHEVVITNTSILPVVWALKGVDDWAAEHPEFTISPGLTGTLPAMQSQTVSFTFKALQQRVIELDLDIEISDTEGVLGVVDVFPLWVQAEAFKIDAEVKFPGTGLNFKTLRVGEMGLQEFTIINKGKYDINFNFTIENRSKRLFNEIFTISPQEGTLKPSADQLVTVTIKCLKEIDLLDNTDIKLHIIETQKNLSIINLPVAVSVRTVYSKYRILPQNGINFEPLERNATRTKRIEIINDGDFDFEYRVYPFDQKPTEPFELPESQYDLALQEKSGKKKGGKKHGDASGSSAVKKGGRRGRKGEDDEAELAIGAFTVGPCHGVVPAGGTKFVMVLIAPNASQVFEEVLGIDIAQAAEQSASVRYVVAGEGCSPGIECQNYQTIFEEQEIVQRLDGRIVSKNCYAIDDNTFSFAPVIANQRSEGRRERFRIVNPFKVPCDLSLSIGQRVSLDDAKSSRAKASKSRAKNHDGEQEACPFVVSPAALHIPAHEHRYVEVLFDPQGIDSYSAVFTAIVDKGLEPASSKLSFNLRGEGTLPHLSIEQPAVRHPVTNNPLVCFPRLFYTPIEGVADALQNPHSPPVPTDAVGATAAAARSRSRYTLPITVRNSGVVPATIRFDMPPEAALHYSFSGRGRMVTVNAGEQHTFDVTFHPRDIGVLTCDLRMTVLQNPFEVTMFHFTGTGYAEQVTLDGLELREEHAAAGDADADDHRPASRPSSSESGSKRSKKHRHDDDDVPAPPVLHEVLVLGDTSLNTASQRTFTMRNHSEDVYRFDWTALLDVDLVADAAAASKGGKTSRRKKDRHAEEEEVQLSTLRSEFSFAPSIGHLPAFGTKEVTVTFKSATARQHDTLPLLCKLERIRYAKRPSTAEGDDAVADGNDGIDGFASTDVDGVVTTQPVDWDNSQTVSRWLTIEELEAEQRAAAEAAAEAAALAAEASSKKSKKHGGKKKGDESTPAPVAIELPPRAEGVNDGDMVEVLEVAREPYYVCIDGATDVDDHSTRSKKKASDKVKRKPSSAVADDTEQQLQREVSLSVAVIANENSYECDVAGTGVGAEHVAGEVTFAQTMMYQKRVFTFAFRNTSTTTLPFAWEVAPSTEPLSIETAYQSAFRRVNRLVAASSKEVSSPSSSPRVGDSDSASSSCGPFSVSPGTGTIDPGVTQTFTVTFAPDEAGPYGHQLVAAIPSLTAKQALPNIVLSGTALRPRCHFDLVSSDYLASGRRKSAELQMSQSSPLTIDPATKVVEFKSLGVRVRNTRRFFVMNPTNVSYSFEFAADNLDEQPIVAASAASGSGDGGLAAPAPFKDPFKCLTPKGVIYAGRKTEMIFEYVPDRKSLVESFWTFRVKSSDHSDDLELPLLLVGSVAEPDVHLDRHHLRFEPLMLGKSQKQLVYLHNEESIPFSWSIDKTTYQSESAAGSAALDIRPSSGVVGPNTRMPIGITFRPTTERHFNYNLAVKVRKKPGRVALNVKGVGYEVRPKLQICDAGDDNHDMRELVSGSVGNVSTHNKVDFGVVHILEKRTKLITISNTNTSNFPMDYSWKVPPNAFVTISPVKGVLAKGESVQCAVTFVTPKAASLDKLVCVCSVANSRAFVVSISGRGKKPNLSFNFLKHDFGPTFVRLNPFGDGSIPTTISAVSPLVAMDRGLVSSRSRVTDMQYGTPASAAATKDSFSVERGEVKLLRIVNNEPEDNVSLEITHVTTPFLEVRAQPAVLTPGEVLEVPVIFSPHAEQKYRDTIPVCINGFYKKNIVVTGEGVPLRLELTGGDVETGATGTTFADVAFGVLRVGQEHSRTYKLVNRSPRPVQFSLFSQTAIATLMDRALSFSPPLDQNVVVQPKESFVVKVTFSPTTRVSLFSETIFVRKSPVLSRNAPGLAAVSVDSRRASTTGTNFSAHRLLSVQGACHGVSVRLTHDKVPFGNVIVQSSFTKKIKIENLGDIGVSFAWPENGVSSEFTISPQSGFVPALDDAIVEVTFHPTRATPLVQVKRVPCLIDSTEMRHMFLSLEGSSLDVPVDEQQMLEFSTSVRQSITHDIVLKNPTDDAWAVTPRIENDLWSGPQLVHVPARGQATYTLSFKPLTLTALPEAVVADDGGKKRGGARGANNKRSTRDKKDEDPHGFMSDDVTEEQIADTRRDDERYRRPKHHQGSILFPFGNGLALSCSLMGYATRADPEQVIELTCCMKETLEHEIDVVNWLPEYQRFNARVTIHEPDPTVSLSGPLSVDVPRLNSRKYKLKFYSYKPTVCNATVTLTNEESGESLLYHIIITVTYSLTRLQQQLPPMETAIRRQLTHQLTVLNPLDTPVTFTDFSCADTAVTVPMPVVIAPRAQGVFKLRYRPLVPAGDASPSSADGKSGGGKRADSKKSTASKPTSKSSRKDDAAAALDVERMADGTVPLVLRSEELGDFVYGMTLRTVPAPPSRHLQFNTTLGSDSVLPYRFVSFAAEPTEYTCTIESQEASSSSSVSSDFSVSSSTKIAAPAATPGGDGVDIDVDVMYEPSAVGDTRDVLVVRGGNGAGVYRVPLVGHCEPPQPQGPILVRPGGTASLSFKNVFDAAENFSVTCDNPDYILKQTAMRVDRKQTVQLPVVYQPNKGSGGGKRQQQDQLDDEPVPASKLSKLIVRCTSPHLSHVAWVFYLKGTAAAPK